METFLDINNIDSEKLSPMMREYLATRDQYPGCIMFYRLGDFYEMFFDDALRVSAELELTLTGKACGFDERAPMCGVPYHAADTYISRLIAKGYKVAVCEQVEDPKQAKGIVKREVIQVVTPGTTLNMGALPESSNNYIACIFLVESRAGLAVGDVSTGDFSVTETDTLQILTDELIKFSPSEIICNEALFMSGIDIDGLKDTLRTSFSMLDASYFDEDKASKLLLGRFKASSLAKLDIDGFPLGCTASGALLKYLSELQKTEDSVFTRITPYSTGRYMLLDSSTRRNLELTETMRDKDRKGTLLWVLDRTRTAMGARLLKKYIEQPLVDVGEINSRLQTVEAFLKMPICREELREYLGPVYDLERLLSRITYKTANPRDIQAFSSSIAMLPSVRAVLAEMTAGEGGNSQILTDMYGELDTLEDIRKLTENALCDELPLTSKDGGIFREGFNEELDHLRQAQVNGKKWLSDLEEKERANTGIKNLRIKYSGVFGYTFEVSNSFTDLVPDRFIRRQTLTNCERYTTPELKKLEDSILGAQDRGNTLEYELFCDLRDQIAEQTGRIQKSAKYIAALDVFSSLATVAEKNHYVKPSVKDDGFINIKDGRHPVVERMLEVSDMFIPNDTRLDNRKNCVSIITGPNMAGKSTYMRQTALIVLMAQIGSFVPAGSADIGVVDRIFTRVGASDDLASGQSTFMVEMNEVSNILRNATRNSLLILDEIGRGTSTYDGLSIAWAVVEHIANRRILGARTLFATHYHELTELEGKLDNVHNYCIAVKEKGDDIVFLRKIVKGGADKSYGIQVAKLAGIPDMVIDRAKEIALQLAENDITELIQNISVESDAPVRSGRKSSYDEVDLAQMSLFDTMKDEDVLKELKEIDVTKLTPLDALNELYRLQNLLVNRW